MEYRKLPGTSVQVSRVCLGTMMFGGQTSEADSLAIMDYAFEHGVNFFDTANVYVQGESERIVGKALKGRRERIILATKVRGQMGEDPNDAGLNRRNIRSAVDKSLKRLNTDYIDICYMHRAGLRYEDRGITRRHDEPRPVRKGALHRREQLRCLADGGHSWPPVTGAASSRPSSPRTSITPSRAASRRNSSHSSRRTPWPWRSTIPSRAGCSRESTGRGPRLPTRALRTIPGTSIATGRTRTLRCG